MLIKKSFLIFILLISCSLFSQKVDKTFHDFEDIYAQSKRYQDFLIANNTSKDLYLLRMGSENRDVKIQYSIKTLKPNESSIIRVQYNPKMKGKFVRSVQIYHSNSFDPITLTIKGRVKEIDPNLDEECPRFDAHKDIAEEMSFSMLITVLDRNTLEPINNSSVLLIRNGLPFSEDKTNYKGEIKKKATPALYYLIAQADSYLSEERQVYINKNKDSVLVLLDKKEELIAQEVIEEEKVEEVRIEEDTLISIFEYPKEEKEEPIEEEMIQYSSLPLSKHKANNIVFLLDISSSMKYEGKLDLTKVAMIELTKVLRDVDYITLIAYSSIAKEVMGTMKVESNKDSIISVISGLEANGMTAGGDGMKKAYESALDNYIDDANNQIIMVTDGDFNRGITNVDYLVRKYKKKVVSISVIGIKNKPIHEKDMRDVAELGGGSYIFVKDYESAKTSLINEIKRMSKK